MKLKNTLRAATAAALMALVSLPASAAYVVLDGWQLITPTSATTNIGRLNLTSGTSSVEQEMAGGSVFVGAQFKKSGAIYNISYTPESVVGAGDIGAPVVLPDSLTLTFNNVGGVVTALNPGGGFHYNFTSGTFVISGGSGNYASGSIVGIGGNTLSTQVIGGAAGDSTVLGRVLAMLNAGFDLRDSSGASLQPDLATGAVLFEAVTLNNVTSQTGSGTCSFKPGATCGTFSVASAGDGYLVRDVPEPGTLALAGLALLGAGAARRRRSSAK